mmetsp:Transcript_57689/g.185379  ORF Transcript_57689/g.185379 Transcript_57689/m.185379 type:complete len:316 (-) Transcript_57689:1089-2036(-)
MCWRTRASSRRPRAASSRSPGRSSCAAAAPPPGTSGTRSGPPAGRCTRPGSSPWCGVWRGAPWASSGWSTQPLCCRSRRPSGPLTWTSGAGAGSRFGAGRHASRSARSSRTRTWAPSSAGRTWWPRRRTCSARASCCCDTGTCPCGTSWTTRSGGTAGASLRSSTRSPRRRRRPWTWRLAPSRRWPSSSRPSAERRAASAPAAPGTRSGAARWRASPHGSRAPGAPRCWRCARCARSGSTAARRRSSALRGTTRPQPRSSYSWRWPRARSSSPLPRPRTPGHRVTGSWLRHLRALTSRAAGQTRPRSATTTAAPW